MKLAARFLHVLVAAMLVAVPTGTASAQERPKTLFQLFFGAKPAPERPAAEPKASQPAKEPARKTTRAGTVTPRVATPDAPLPVEKAEDARKILVVGDFTAGTVAGGIAEMVEQRPDVVVVNAANGSSGLVRDDFYNWPAEIGGLITTHQPAAVVVMIGANDRQQMSVAGTREAVRSEAWLVEYRRRASALAKAVADRSIPLLWIGQVPYKSTVMTADMLAFNDLYRAVVQNAAKAEYVDVWEGFVDEDGKFVSRGPDVNGQIVALRSGTVNLTRAGGRKIAFYAEKPLMQVLGEPGRPGLPELGEDNLPVLSLDAPGLDTAIERIRPVALNSPDLDGGDALLGATVAPPSDPAMAPSAKANRVNGLAPRP